MRSAALRPIVRGGREIAGRAHAVVPVVALHAGVVLGDQRARQRMARAALACRLKPSEFAYAVIDAPACTDGAVGIVDARIERAAGVLDLDAEARSPPAALMSHGCQRSRSGNVPRQQRRIGEAVRGILLGVARDRAGLLDRLLDRLRIEVGGAAPSPCAGRNTRSRETPRSRVRSTVSTSPRRTLTLRPASMLAATSASLAPLARQRRITSSAICREAVEVARSWYLVVDDDVVHCAIAQPAVACPDAPTDDHARPTIPDSDESLGPEPQPAAPRRAGSLRARRGAGRAERRRARARAARRRPARRGRRARAPSPRTSRASGRRSSSPSRCASSTMPRLERDPRRARRTIATRRIAKPPRCTASKRWRERLIDEGDAALDELLALHPSARSPAPAPAGAQRASRTQGEQAAACVSRAVSRVARAAG